jgi:hypothetical protein
MSKLSSPIDYSNLHLMSSVEEARNLAQFDVQIVLANLQTDAHLLHVERLTFRAGFLLLFRSLIIIFTPVDDARDRRVGIGRNLDQVELGFAGGGQRLLTAYNTELSAIISYNSKTRCADCLVYRGLSGYCFSPTMYVSKIISDSSGNG